MVRAEIAEDLDGANQALGRFADLYATSEYREIVNTIIVGLPERGLRSYLAHGHQLWIDIKHRTSKRRIGAPVMWRIRNLL